MFSDDVRGNVLETKSIVSQFPKVVPEHLFIQISEQVERLHADVCTLELMLEQTPEVFESVCVNPSINVPLRMIDNLVLEASLLPALM